MSNFQGNQVIECKQRARTLFQQGNLTQAKTLYEKLCRENMADTESHYMLGSIHGQLGRYDEAIKHFLQVVKYQPTAFIAHCGLGAAHKQLRQYKCAEQAFREALKLQPDDPKILFELADTMLKQDNLISAEEYLQRVVQLEPESAEALELLGEISHSRRQLNRAIDYYQRALRIKPNLAQTHNRLGHALHTLGKPHEAIEHYQKALQIHPGVPHVYYNLGQALASIGNMEAAMAAYRQAQKIRPDYIDAIVGEAALYEREGKFAATHEKLAPLVDQGVRHPGIASLLANTCHHYGRCQEAIDYMERLLTDTLSNATQEKVHFTLGKLYDSLASYDKAFEHFQQGNSLKPGSFDPDNHTAMIDALISTFDWNLLVTAPRTQHRSDRPVFIVGMPRSGTTLTEQILASHPEVFGAGELMTVMNMVKRSFGQSGPGPGFPHSMKKITPEIVDTMAVEYLDVLNRLDTKAIRVIDKMPQNFMHLGIISLAFPEARIIHCIRDPRDICLSIYFQPFSDSHTYAKNLEHLGHYYRQYHRLMQHWKSLLNLPVLEIRYEDLVSNQEEVSRRLIEFSGLEWNDRCLLFHENARDIATISYDQVRQPIYSKSVARWKNYEKHIGPLLDALGGDLIS